MKTIQKLRLAENETRNQAKAFLRQRYPDYDARRHDAFVYRYQHEQDQAALQAYLAARGLK